MRGCVSDKIFAPLNDVPALAYSLREFEESALFSGAVFVYRDEEQRDNILSLALKFAPQLARNAIFCQGGNERKDSVLNGLRAAATDASLTPDTLAFIHDCARPLIAAGTLKELASVATREGGAVLAHRCKNTIKRVPADTETGTACLTEDLERARLWEMETPQVFPLGKILAAYQKVNDENLFVTDDVAAAAHLGIPVAIVENLSPNPKLTVPEDLIFCEALIRHR